MSAVAERYAAALASVTIERKRDAKGDLSAFIEMFSIRPRSCATRWKARQ